MLKIQKVTTLHIGVVINAPKEPMNKGLFIAEETVNDKPYYTVFDNSTGNANVEETDSKFKAYAYLGLFADGEMFHSKCSTCGMPINDVCHVFDKTLCEDCLHLEYPKPNDWKEACEEWPDECYYTEYTEDMEYIVSENEADNPIDKFELIKIKI